MVPTYNERERLADLVHAIFRSYADAGVDGELVIVDDNSPDGTGAIADDLAQHYRIIVVHRAGKLGLGTAVVEGFERASAPVVGVIDADLSHPPEMLPRMLAVMTGSSADIGDRQPLHPRRRHPQLAVRAAADVAARLPRRPAADAGGRRDLRAVPDPARSRAHGDDLGRRVQDLPRAARARPAGVGGRSAVRLLGPRRGREQDEHAGRRSATSTQLRDLWRFQRAQPPLQPDLPPDRARASSA